MSRPTELHFRSPKQKTPEFYNVNVLLTYPQSYLQMTQDGRRLTYVTTEEKCTERKASFHTSLKRFPQYDQWARKTSVFLGPGVYHDQTTYTQLTKQPCAVKYKLTHLGKEAGKQCYTMIGEHMLMYEPGHEKHYDKKDNTVITSTEQAKIPLSSIFGSRTMSHFKQSRNSKHSFTSGQKSINEFSKRQNSQSFYTDNKERPNTSYVNQSEQVLQSHSRGIRSTQSQSRNNTKTNFSGFTSQYEFNGSHIPESIRSQNMTAYHPGTNVFKSQESQDRMFGQNSNLQGCEIQKLDNSNGLITSHQPRDNPNFQADDRLISSNPIELTQMIMSKDKRPKTSLASRKQSRKNQHILDLKKSVTLLQAYGEYDRFLQISKKYMKENGIIIKKNLKKKRKRGASERMGEQQMTQGEQEIESDLLQENRGVSANDEYIEMDKILNKKLGSSEVLIEQ